MERKSDRTSARNPRNMFRFGIVCAAAENCFSRDTVSDFVIYFFSFIFNSSFFSPFLRFIFQEKAHKKRAFLFVSISSAMFTTFSFYSSCLRFKWHEWTRQLTICNERYVEYWRRCCVTADKHTKIHFFLLCVVFFSPTHALKKKRVAHGANQMKVYMYYFCLFCVHFSSSSPISLSIFFICS